MKCVICHSADIEEKTVNEIFWVEQDVVLVPCQVLVCNNCGERYYNRQVMRRLEEIEEHLQARTLALESVGQVMRVAVAPSEQPALSIREPRTRYRTEPPEPSEPQG